LIIIKNAELFSISIWKLTEFGGFKFKNAIIWNVPLF